MQDAAVLRCTLSEWGGHPKRCRWCDTELPPKHRRWCSPECRSVFYANHLWTFARDAALKRDGFACVECGVLEVKGPAPGGFAEMREGRGEWVHLQVHHDPPVLGNHARNGCHHHQDRLITLCSQWWDGRQSCHNRAHFGVRVQGGKQLALELV